jgi:hypothetical protein
MLVTMVVLTASAGWSAGGTVSTYCEGVCEGTGQPILYKCGYTVSGPQCCSRARNNACPGDTFSGTCTETYGTLMC